MEYMTGKGDCWIMCGKTVNVSHGNKCLYRDKKVAVLKSVAIKVAKLVVKLVVKVFVKKVLVKKVVLKKEVRLPSVVCRGVRMMNGGFWVVACVLGLAMMFVRYCWVWSRRCVLSCFVLVVFRCRL